MFSRMYRLPACTCLNLVTHSAIHSSVMCTAFSVHANGQLLQVTLLAEIWHFGIWASSWVQSHSHSHEVRKVNVDIPPPKWVCKFVSSIIFNNEVCFVTLSQSFLNRPTPLHTLNVVVFLSCYYKHAGSLLVSGCRTLLMFCKICWSSFWLSLSLVCSKKP